MKICSKCKVEKPLTEFIDGILTCKACLVKKKKYYQANKDKYKKYKKTFIHKMKAKKTQMQINFEKFKIANVLLFAYLEKNKIKLKRYKDAKKSKLWAKKNPKKMIEIRKRNAHKKGLREKLAMQDPMVKLIKTLRCRTRSAIRDNRATKSATTLELLGSSVAYARKHLESQFVDGMSWDNHGEWHIDHIRPCASFDLTDPDQQKECFNYKNLQPLWAEDNLSKSDRWI